MCKKTCGTTVLFSGRPAACSFAGTTCAVPLDGVGSCSELLSLCSSAGTREVTCVGVGSLSTRGDTFEHYIKSQRKMRGRLRGAIV